MALILSVILTVSLMGGFTVLAGDDETSAQDLGESVIIPADPGEDDGDLIPPNDGDGGLTGPDGGGDGLAVGSEPAFVSANADMDIHCAPTTPPCPPAATLR